MNFSHPRIAGGNRETAPVPALPSMHRRLFALLTLFILASLIAQPVSGLVNLEYFHQQGCVNCAKTDPVIDAVSDQYRGRVTVERIEIDDRAGVRLLLSYGVTEIPVVVINRNKVLTWTEITPGRLDTEIRLAESGAYPVPVSRRSIFDGDNLLSVLFCFALGLMTGLSPCLLGSLVILIAAAGGVAGNGTAGKYYPVVFGAGIITAYLIAAAGILGAGMVFSPDAVSRLVLYGIAGLVAIVAGLIQTGLVTLPARIQQRTSALAARFRTLPGIFLLGIVFSVLFAPCAIAPFLILIETILLGNSLAPVIMLLAFSAGVLAPFAVLTAIRHSIPGEKVLRLAGILQKLGGLLLIGFGCWLILSI
jgi:cytochrome c-type biogenesis protein